MADKFSTATPDRKVGLISLARLIPLVLAGLVVLAVLPVLVTGYVISTDTANRLLSDRNRLIVDGLENTIRNQLDPVADQLNFARQAILDGIIDPEDEEALRNFTRGLLGGTPQVAGVALLGEDLSMRLWQRSTLAELAEPAESPTLASEAIQSAKLGQVSYWTQPFVSPLAGDTVLSHRVALERDGEVFAVLAAAVTSQALSRYVAEISKQFGVTAFVLLGQERVVTYPGREPGSAEAVSFELPLLADDPNPVIAGMWTDPQPLQQVTKLQRTTGHSTYIEGVPYAYYYRELAGYGPETLTIGVAMPSVDSRRDRWASTVAAGLGFVLMLVAATAAWFLGRRMTRPTAEFNEALNAISRLDFAAVSLPNLENSRVLEWRGLARNLSSTAKALTAFQTYLPRSLVRRIFRTSHGSVRSREREVTIMFADLEGFTAFSRGRDAAEVAAHLNDLFGAIGPILEDTGGVIDKYTGDGLLCFWGAPDPQPDHAARACSAAAAIAHVMETRARESVVPFPRLRVGMHSGKVVAGNIGFPGRINYTLVGDTVNIAERTQKALRGVQPHRPCVIALTQAVLDAGGNQEGTLQVEGELPGVAVPAYRCRPGTANNTLPAA